MINFPDAPALDDEYTAAGSTWRYDGVKWVPSAGTPAPPPYVLKAGDVMTGSLTMPANPVADMEVSTKAYADTMLPLTGGTLTGPLEGTEATFSGSVSSSASVVKGGGNGIHIDDAANEAKVTYHLTDGVIRWAVGQDFSSNYSWSRHDATGAPIDFALSLGISDGYLECAGRIRSQQGYVCQAGTGGPISNAFNLYWTGAACQLWIDSTVNGTINTTPVAAFDYGTPLALMWDTVKALNPVVVEDDTPLPEDVEGVAPRAASRQVFGFDPTEMREALAVDTSPSSDHWTVIAVLTKALQEAMARIEALEGGAPARDVTVNTVNVQPRARPRR